MKILMIGNSFSTDTSRYVEDISAGELFVRNLYIGGCSLRTHAAHVEDGAAAYEYQKNSEMIEMSSIRDALMREEWDVVTVQQVSGESGLVETYEPYIGILLDEVRRCVPSARIVFHKTWTYENGSTHQQFHYYRSDRRYMKKRIDEAVAYITDKYSLPVIPVGDAVAAAREYAEFDPERGGAMLSRDGFHLTLDYGRYLAGLVFCRFFTGKSAAEAKYVPDGCVNEKYLEIIRTVADATV